MWSVTIVFVTNSLVALLRMLSNLVILVFLYANQPAMPYWCTRTSSEPYASSFVYGEANFNARLKEWRMDRPFLITYDTCFSHLGSQVTNIPRYLNSSAFFTWSSGGHRWKSKLFFLVTACRLFRLRWWASATSNTQLISAQVHY